MDGEPHTQPHRVLSLIGYRCTGKTTVGRLLAQKLAWTFADADDWVREMAQKEIADIFQDDGESTFRDWEEQAIATLLQQTPLVLSVGGGAVMQPANAAALTAAGPVVWLLASPEEIVRRLECDPVTLTQRPSLTSQSVTTEVADVLAQRAPVYQSCATFMIDTEGKTPAEVADEVYRQVTTKG
jgi:shikimate kinase